MEKIEELKTNPVRIGDPSRYKVGPKPTVKLINWTPRPLETCWHSWTFCKEMDTVLPPTLGVSITPLSHNDSRPTPERPVLEDFFRKIMKDWTAIPEFISFTFACTNIPRALMDQMTRHRLWSFFVQSMRVRDMKDFAENREYFVPDAVCAAGQVVHAHYEDSMVEAQFAYEALVKAGVPVEDARGVLPLHATTQLMVAMNMRAFFQAIRKRSCWLLQSQYWAPLMTSMRDELVLKVDPLFGELFEPPCVAEGKCLTKLEQEIRIKGNDPNPPCPMYAKIWGLKEEDGQA